MLSLDILRMSFWKQELCIEIYSYVVQYKLLSITFIEIYYSQADNKGSIYVNVL